jgi:hypothetical protein
VADRLGAGSCAPLRRFPADVTATLEDLHGVQVYHSLVASAIQGNDADRHDSGRVTGTASDHCKHLLAT